MYIQRLHIDKEFVGRSLEKSLRLCHQIHLFLKEAQFFFKFEYLLFDLRLKKCCDSMLFPLFQITGSTVYKNNYKVIQKLGRVA